MKTSPIHAIHQSRGAKMEAAGAWQVPSHYGDWQREAACVYESAVVFDLSHWTKFALRGPDRKNFLHGLLSNHVKSLQPSEGNYSLLLTPKGKVMADFVVNDRGEELLLWGQEGIRWVAWQALNKYLIMEQVEILDLTETMALFSVQGERAEEIFGRWAGEESMPPREYESKSLAQGGVAARVFHTGRTGFDLFVANEQAEAVWRSLADAGLQPAGMKALEALRVEAGIPIVGRELDDTVIPQEATLFAALAFDKGCFVGQEVVARLHFRGHVNRELTGFVLEAEPPMDSSCQNVATIHHEGKTVGKITSVVESPRLGRSIGLGFLNCALRQPGTRLAARQNDQEFTVTVHALPF